MVRLITTLALMIPAMAMAQDADLDGYDAAEDCNDADAYVFPGAFEASGDGIDNDCDGTTDGVAMVAGDGIDSLSGNVRLQYQTDGNFVLYTRPASGQSWTARWASHTAGSTTKWVALQPDGNVVVRDADGTAVWASNTGGNSGAHVLVDDTGFFEIVSASGTQLWVSNDPVDADGDGIYMGYDVDDNDASVSLDFDGDGVAYENDCNMFDATIYPGAPEIYGDGIDQDCDGYDDCAEDVGIITYYHDFDGDGYGSVATGNEDLILEPVYACEAPEGYVDNDDDCEPLVFSANPGVAYEDVTTLFIDDNCDGTAGPTDLDGDGWYGDYMANNELLSSDCDDSDPLTFPGAAVLEEWACMTDADGDGYGDANPVSGVTEGTDCDDSNASINMDAQEIYDDGIDWDCDGHEEPYAGCGMWVGDVVKIFALGDQEAAEAYEESCYTTHDQFWQAEYTICTVAPDSDYWVGLYDHYLHGYGQMKLDARKGLATEFTVTEVSTSATEQGYFGLKPQHIILDLEDYWVRTYEDDLWTNWTYAKDEQQETNDKWHRFQDSGDGYCYVQGKALDNYWQANGTEDIEPDAWDTSEEGTKFLFTTDIY